MPNLFSEFFSGFLTFIGVSIVLFIICREIVCWYWKINLMNEKLSKIEGHLSELVNLFKNARPGGKNIDEDVIEI